MALLEGLEISEITLTECADHVDNRMDSEFHIKLPKESPLHNWVPIKDILTMSQYGASIEMNELDIGTPIYRMNEIHNMLCDSEILKSAVLNKVEIEKYKLHNRDVLFNRTNSQAFVGRTGVYISQNQKTRTFASYLVRFRTDEQRVLPEYLASFLNSKRGVSEVKRRARMSINQSNVNPEEVKAIRIPLIDLTFQHAIKNLFITAHSQLLESQTLHAQAEETLLDALGLKDWQPPNPLAYEASASEVLGASRIDAEFYRPRVKELLHLLGKDSLKIADIANLRNKRFKGTSDEFNYLEIGAMSKDGTVADSYISGDNAPSRATWKVAAGDVITSTVRPIRSLTATVSKEQNGAIASSGFCVLEPVQVSSEVLQTYLKLPIICELMDLYTSASMYPAISVTDILNLPFAKPDKQSENKISKYIKEGKVAKTESHRLLECAKRAVEIAIEQDEAAAFDYLEENSL